LEAFEFYEGPVPSGYSFCFEESLFNLAEHRMLQAPEGWLPFYVLNTEDKTICASIYFYIESGEAKSPLRSPYGSVEFSGSVPEIKIFEFLKFFEQRLRQKNITSITIKNYPEAYYKHHATLLQVFYSNLHYSVITAEVGSVIHVNHRNIKLLYHRSEKRRMEKAVSRGFAVRQLPVASATVVYTFIERCRKEKNYVLSMSADQFKVAVNKFPDRYLLFGVFDGEKMIAGSIVIRIKKNIVYDFFHDHDPAYDQYSPVALLVAGMYSFCQQNDIELFDLGTSALNGLPNFSLLHFKKFLGGQPTAKFVFHKDLL
jgi:hypothetical protein